VVLENFEKQSRSQLKVTIAPRDLEEYARQW
jgi:hypothetical protein